MKSRRSFLRAVVGALAVPVASRSAPASQISSGPVTTPKIGALSISNARVSDLAIGAIKMEGR